MDIVDEMRPTINAQLLCQIKFLKPKYYGKYTNFIWFLKFKMKKDQLPYAQAHCLITKIRINVLKISFFLL